VTPWSPQDAPSHTKKANTAHLKRLWADAANNALKQYDSDSMAITVANAAVAKAKRKKKGK